MSKRGPDATGVHSQAVSPDKNLYLLHSRLSIIDLEAHANQPFAIGQSTLIFNGEIYNYVELRRQLGRENVQFRTESDTEVLLQCYLRYGEACVERFEGMWSFAIWDEARQTLFLSRDRFAEKPLYLHRTDHGIYWGSEVKFIAALVEGRLSVNHSHLLRYMVNGYKSLYKTKETFFQGIEELPFASNLVVNADLSDEISSYWTPEHRPTRMTIREAIDGFRERLLDSVRVRLRADVPLAFCLSGGVDSSAIVSVAAKCFDYDVATFSIIDSDERYNERDNIEATIDDLKCKHTLIETSREGFFDRLADLVNYHDAPLYTISYYIHSHLSEAIAHHGYRVVCSGTGADEMVTGYYDHFNLYLYEMRNSSQYARYRKEWHEHTGRFVRNPYLQNPELYFDDPSFRGHIYLNNELFSSYVKSDFEEEFLEIIYCEALLQNRMLNEMFHEGTRVILHEDDLNSMRCSIENRSPYLDTDVFDFAFSIPTEYLVQDGYGKYVLREAVKDILNERVRLDRRKRGFNASITSLVDFSDSETRAQILDDGPIYELIDREKIETSMQGGVLPNSMSKFLFYFLNAQEFLRQHA